VILLSTDLLYQPQNLLTELLNNNGVSLFLILEFSFLILYSSIGESLNDQVGKLPKILFDCSNTGVDKLKRSFYSTK
jgi:hypothetical protein